METFSNALNDDEESRIYDQAFDTFSRQAESGGASFDKVPTFLAAHTFNTAKSSLSALMPSAELPEIRAAAEEHPEVAKWVSLLDTSSEFLEAATEQHEGRDLAPCEGNHQVGPGTVLLEVGPAVFGFGRVTDDAQFEVQPRCQRQSDQTAATVAIVQLQHRVGEIGHAHAADVLGVVGLDRGRRQRQRGYGQ